MALVRPIGISMTLPVLGGTRDDMLLAKSGWLVLERHKSQGIGHICTFSLLASWAPSLTAINAKSFDAACRSHFFNKGYQPQYSGLHILSDSMPNARLILCPCTHIDSLFESKFRPLVTSDPLGQSAKFLPQIFGQSLRAFPF
jgi:hypothetical protein